MFAQSKYKRKYHAEAYRESQIQSFMAKNGWDRKRAVHQYDYNQEINRQFKGSKYKLFYFF